MPTSDRCRVPKGRSYYTYIQTTGNLHKLVDFKKRGTPSDKFGTVKLSSGLTLTSSGHIGHIMK